MAFKYALCSEVFSTPLSETITQIAMAGFDGIEIAPFNAADSVEEVSADQRLVLADGDILEVRTHVLNEWIDGRPVNLSANKHTTLWEKYRDRPRPVIGRQQ